MYVFYNPNPQEKRTDDCVVRMLTKALSVDWETASIYAVIQQIRDVTMKNFGLSLQ